MPTGAHSYGIVTNRCRIRIHTCRMRPIHIAMSKKRVVLAIAAAVLLVVTLLTIPAFLVNFIIQGD